MSIMRVKVCRILIQSVSVTYFRCPDFRVASMLLDGLLVSMRLDCMPISVATGT